MPTSILVVEDEAILGKNICRYLERHGYEAVPATSGEEGLARLDDLRPDIVVLDFNLPGMDGLDVLRRIRATDRRIRVVIITGHGSERVAVDAMKAGAYEYLSKPIVLESLRIVVDKAVAEMRLSDELDYYRSRDARGSALLVGRSPAMVRLRSLIEQVVEADRKVTDGHLPAVLVTGPTGTGKELIARAIHFDGPRRDAPFVEVNCAAIPGQLLEAELFGYERGAFTDAKDRKPGLIETADHGTLFLDEIGDLDLALQAKLLKVIEDRRVRRLGSVRDQHSGARIVAAANRDLERLVQEGRFRADLFFRLRIIHVEAPPLAARGEDIELLAEHFLGLHARRYGRPGLRFAPEALEALRAHAWPGNVRELRNVVEQAVVLARGDVLSAEAFPALSAADGRRAAADDSTVTLPPSGLTLGRVERELLSQALAQSGWNITRAARLLGITRDTLRYRMEKFSLRPPTGDVA
jgi:DNA-binding NtrC family response regulator